MKIHPSRRWRYEKTITQARWLLTYELIEQMYTIFKRERINSQHSQHSHPYFCFSFSAQLVRLCDHEDFYNPLLQMVYFPLFLPPWKLKKTEKYLILPCKEKKNNLDHGKGVLRFEARYWEVCFQLQVEGNPEDIKQLWVKKRAIESSLARGRKVWIVASKFENVCEHVQVEIWYTHDITLFCFYRLPAESFQYYEILEGYHHSGSFFVFTEAFKQIHKVKPKPPLDLREFFWATFTLYKQVLINMIDVVFSYTTFQAENKKDFEFTTRALRFR